MKKFIVFATRNGDVFALPPDQFWIYWQNHKNMIIRYLSVYARTNIGAILSERAYVVLTAANTHHILNVRGYE